MVIKQLLSKELANRAEQKRQRAELAELAMAQMKAKLRELGLDLPI